MIQIDIEIIKIAQILSESDYAAMQAYKSLIRNGQKIGNVLSRSRQNENPVISE